MQFRPKGATINQPRASDQRERRPGVTEPQKLKALKGNAVKDFCNPLFNKMLRRFLGKQRMLRESLIGLVLRICESSRAIAKDASLHMKPVYPVIYGKSLFFNAFGKWLTALPEGAKQFASKGCEYD